MPNTNIVILEGHLGSEPEARELGSGVIVCNFSLATSTGRDEKKKTQWHSCKIFGSLATELAMNGRTGDVVSLKGRIEYRKWEDKYFTDIIVDYLKLTKKRSNKGGGNMGFEPEDEEVPF